jgi:hypothetical protein
VIIHVITDNQAVVVILITKDIFLLRDRKRDSGRVARCLNPCLLFLRGGDIRERRKET